MNARKGQEPCEPLDKNHMNLISTNMAFTGTHPNRNIKVTISHYPKINVLIY